MLLVTHLCLFLLFAVVSPAVSDQMPGVLPNEQGNSTTSGTMLSAAPSLVVKRFDITGNSIIITSELTLLTKPYLDKKLNIEQLEKMRQTLNALYIQKGYVNSGVIIPDQNVADGVVKLTVIEGKLSGLEITGAVEVTANETTSAS